MYEKKYSVIRFAIYVPLSIILAFFAFSHMVTKEIDNDYILYGVPIIIIAIGVSLAMNFKINTEESNSNVVMKSVGVIVASIVAVLLIFCLVFFLMMIGSGPQ